MHVNTYACTLAGAGGGGGNNGGGNNEMVVAGGSVVVVAVGSPISARQYLCMHTCKFSPN